MSTLEGWFCSAKLFNFPIFAIALFCTVQFWKRYVSICITVIYETRKHFHMNSVVRQLLEQNTDVVMVDTGDSYEGICRYFAQNFGEKKNFLKSLIFLIFKGSEAPTKIEDMRFIRHFE